jgi:glycopeptide antibiotics resistance protein
LSQKRKLLIYSFYTFGLLLAYELLELIKGLGTFDWLDLMMTILGLVTLNIIFQNFKSTFEPIFEK